MNIFDKISKTYKQRIESGLSSEKARIFTSMDFVNIDREALKELQNQGLIELWINNAFTLTDYCIERLSN